MDNFPQDLVWLLDSTSPTFKVQTSFLCACLLKPTRSYLNQTHRKGLSGVFDEPFGVTASNEDTDNFEDQIIAEISEIKTTHSPNTPDPLLRKTARTTIAKPAPRSITKTAKKIPIVSKSKSAVQDPEDEAEKRRERVRKCRRKKKEKKEEDLLKKEFLVADNTQREDNIARMNQQLAQMSEILAVHNRAQPDVAASLLSSLMEEISQPDVPTVLSSFFY